MHVIEPPSPIDQSVTIGVALIASVTPPANAVVTFGVHDEAGDQAHKGTPTYCVVSAAGAIVIGGAGMLRVPYT